MSVGSELGDSCRPVVLKSVSSRNSCNFLEIPSARCTLPLNTSCDISKNKFEETLDPGTDLNPRNTRETVNFCQNDTQGQPTNATRQYRKVMTYLISIRNYSCRHFRITHSAVSDQRPERPRTITGRRGLKRGGLSYLTQFLKLSISLFNGFSSQLINNVKSHYDNVLFQTKNNHISKTYNK